LGLAYFLNEYPHNTGGGRQYAITAPSLFVPLLFGTLPI